ncbi:hypothetical protein LINPERHAP1_LOCUS34381, partial [Linum perenne]
SVNSVTNEKSRVSAEIFLPGVGQVPNLNNEPPGQRPRKKEDPTAFPHESLTVKDPGEVKKDNKEKTKEDWKPIAQPPFAKPPERNKIIHAHGKHFTLAGGSPRPYFMNSGSGLREILSWDVP